MLEEKKIAIVCDWIKDWGGAELVLSHILEMFPHADIYTSVFWQEKNPLFQNYMLDGKQLSQETAHNSTQHLSPTLSCQEREQTQKTPSITTSFIQKIPCLNKSHKLALTLRPLAFESFDLSGYDIVISSTSAESKGVITKPDCLHICYCHTPTRYFWSHYHEYMQMTEFGLLNPLAKWLMPKMIHTLRKWDFCAAQRPDFFLANSENTASRIKKYYKREAMVLYPGIEMPREPQQPSYNFLPKGEMKLQDQDFYLAVGRCIPYKKFDLLVEAFNQNGKKLICVTNTDNKLYRKLQKISGPNIEWKLGISRDETQALFASAKAFLFPPEEDFGLVPLEAMAHGIPVIAYGKGGALETVIAPHNTSLNSASSPHNTSLNSAPGHTLLLRNSPDLLPGEMQPQNTATGVFFMEQTPESLNAAIEQFETMQFDEEYIKKHAARFSKEVFQEKLVRFIEEKLQEKKS